MCFFFLAPTPLLSRNCCRPSSKCWVWFDCVLWKDKKTTSHRAGSFRKLPSAHARLTSITIQLGWGEFRRCSLGLGLFQILMWQQARMCTIIVSVRSVLWAVMTIAATLMILVSIFSNRSGLKSIIDNTSEVNLCKFMKTNIIQMDDESEAAANQEFGRWLWELLWASVPPAPGPQSGGSQGVPGPLPQLQEAQWGPDGTLLWGVHPKTGHAGGTVLRWGETTTSMKYRIVLIITCAGLFNSPGCT